jgi:hypothetical protein
MMRKTNTKHLSNIYNDFLNQSITPGIILRTWPTCAGQ